MVSEPRATHTRQFNRRAAAEPCHRTLQNRRFTASVEQLLSGRTMKSERMCRILAGVLSGKKIAKLTSVYNVLSNWEASLGNVSVTDSFW